MPTRRQFLKQSIGATDVAGGTRNLLAGERTPLADERSELLIHNARVYTVDQDRPWAEAVVIRGERVVWVGDNHEASKQVSADARVIDAKGRLVLPSV